MLSWILRNQKLILKNFIMCGIPYNYCIVDNEMSLSALLKRFCIYGNIFVYFSKITCD